MYYEIHFDFLLWWVKALLVELVAEFALIAILLVVELDSSLASDT